MPRRGPPHSSGKILLARDAIDVVLRRLSELPITAEVGELRAKAESCRSEVETWVDAPPPTEERERLMKEALRLHLEVAKIEQGIQSRDEGKPTSGYEGKVASRDEDKPKRA